MYQRGRDVGFLNRRMNVLGTTAANALDEVCVMVARTLAVRPGFGTIVQPRLVSIVSIDGEIALCPIEDVANGVGLCIFWPQGLLARGLFVCIGGESRGGHTTGTVSAGAYLGLMVGDPVADFEFHHLALAPRNLETEAGIQSIGCLLVVIEHEVSTHGRHGRGEPNAQTPARDVDFVDCLVTDFTVAGVPDPMPIVVKAITRERL